MVETPLREVTGSEAGYSGSQQIRIALQEIAARGGVAQMPDLYAALDAVLNPQGMKLSEQGRASLRYFVNKVSVENDYVHPHDDDNPGWRITPRGLEFIESGLPNQEADMNPQVQIQDAMRDQFAELFEEFTQTYPQTPDGQYHLDLYPEGSEQGRQNFQQIVSAADEGQDITDQVLLKLLPHSNTDSNREKGAWIHIAPAVTGNIKSWFERAGWTDPDDWPRISQAILHFVRRCNDAPHELEAACKEFAALPYSKGFQCAMLTPILNALRPDDFLLINNKPRQTINYFGDQSFGQSLAEYPVINAYGHQLIRALAATMHQHDVPDLPDQRLFDMFSHWLVAVKKFSFRPPHYWKIAPGAQAWNWKACRDGGFIAIGWDELGDLTGLTRKEFDARRDELVAKFDDWKKVGVNQAWRFSNIQEGDRIVANRGTTELLGFGTVVGLYYFAERGSHRHRLPVRWDDLTLRQVDQGGWRKTLVRLDAAKFELVSHAPPLEMPSDLAAPFSRIFASSDEANWAFDLLRDALKRLGVQDPADERFALTLPHDRRTLRLDFGNWLVLQISDPTRTPFRFGVALADEEIELSGEYEQSDPFANTDPIIRVYDLPMELARPLEGSLGQAYEKTFARIADRFQHWTGSPFRGSHQDQIALAVFDPELRQKLLSQGIDRSHRVLPEDKGSYTPGKPAADCPFSSKTFEMLTQLYDEPTYDFYVANKEQLREHIVEPFKKLMLAVPPHQPVAILDTMETEKRVFANILKQFTKHGCWDFYWGAFYPKGGKRTQDAQLFMVINRHRLEFGFYIGEYGSEQRKLFLRNCRENYDVLVRRLEPTIPERRILFFGQRDDSVGTAENQQDDKPSPTFIEWLKDPATAGIHAAVFMPKDEVLARSLDDLAREISDTFQRFFPLVLLATLEDPMPAIGAYLEGTEPPELNPEYSLSHCAEDTGLDQDQLARWVRAIERKGQAVLYGPPGTGKTYVAEHLAKHLIGGGDGFCEVVQFHPAYAYEDFIQGIRPKPRADGQLGFPVVPGRFLDFCEDAKDRNDRCVLILDEINRANLARVFGELMYLLEYRNREIPLAAGGVLRIPSNVRIIGTMNTADRSIALVDHALRRRFAFLALYPNYDILRRYHLNTGFDPEPIIQVLRKLNRQIDDRHYEVGITFFLRQDLADQLEDIWCMEIEPYLEEYFFDQPEKAKAFGWDRVAGDIVT